MLSTRLVKTIEAAEFRIQSAGPQDVAGEP